MLVQKCLSVGRTAYEGELAAVYLKGVFPAFIEAQVIVAAQKMKLGEKALGVAPQPEKMIRLGGRYGRHDVSFCDSDGRF